MTLKSRRPYLPCELFAVRCEQLVRGDRVESLAIDQQTVLPCECACVSQPDSSRRLMRRGWMSGLTMSNRTALT